MKTVVEFNERESELLSELASQKEMNIEKLIQVKICSIAGRKEEALELGGGAFGFLSTPGDVKQILSSRCDWSLSYGAEVDGKLVGAYFLRAGDCPFSNMKIPGNGVEGVGLMVHPDYQGQGVGTLLVEHSASLGFDYIWGMNHEKLKNLPFWLKRRKVITKASHCFITCQIF